MRFAFLGLVLVVAGCALPPSGVPLLVSGRFPPTTNCSHCEPEPINSLPVGASNFDRGPNATHPNYATLSFAPPIPFLGPGPY